MIDKEQLKPVPFIIVGFFFLLTANSWKYFRFDFETDELNILASLGILVAFMLLGVVAWIVGSWATKNIVTKRKAVV